MSRRPAIAALLAAIVAVLLNLFFKGLASQEKAQEQARDSSHGSD